MRSILHHATHSAGPKTVRCQCCELARTIILHSAHGRVVTGKTVTIKPCGIRLLCTPFPLKSGETLSFSVDLLDYSPLVMLRGKGKITHSVPLANGKIQLDIEIEWMPKEDQTALLNHLSTLPPTHTPCSVPEPTCMNESFYKPHA